MTPTIAICTEAIAPFMQQSLLQHGFVSVRDVGLFHDPDVVSGFSTELVTGSNKGPFRKRKSTN
jgi:hypothetical protein